MVAESSYFVRKQSTLRHLYGIEEDDDDEEGLDTDADALQPESESKPKSVAAATSLSKLLLCGLQGAANSTGDFSPFSEGCSAGYGSLTSDDISFLSSDRELSQGLLTNIKEVTMKSTDREDHEEVVFEAVRKVSLTQSTDVLLFEAYCTASNAIVTHTRSLRITLGKADTERDGKAPTVYC
jgi:hypothetical protein